MPSRRSSNLRLFATDSEDSSTSCFLPSDMHTSVEYSTCRLVKELEKLAQKKQSLGLSMCHFRVSITICGHVFVVVLNSDLDTFLSIWTSEVQ